MNQASELQKQHTAIVNELDKAEMVVRGKWGRWTFAKTPCVGRINPGNDVRRGLNEAFDK